MSRPWGTEPTVLGQQARSAPAARPLPGPGFQRRGPGRRAAEGDSAREAVLAATPDAGSLAAVRGPPPAPAPAPARAPPATSALLKTGSPN